MREFAPEALTEEQISRLLLIWKDYHALFNKATKDPPCSSYRIHFFIGIKLLLDWIRSGIEYKLKKELYNATKLRQQETLIRKNEMASIIEKANGVVQDLEARISSYKADLVYSALLPVLLTQLTNQFRPTNENCSKLQSSKSTK